MFLTYAFSVALLRLFRAVGTVSVLVLGRLLGTLSSHECGCGLRKSDCASCTPSCPGPSSRKKAQPV
eukprot:2391933-Amphidinium_carterae.2